MQPDETRPSGPPEPVPAEAGDEARGPVGTLFVLLLYLMALVGMWGTLYWLLLSR